MTSVRARGFVEVLQGALSNGPMLSQADVEALQRARKGIGDDRQAAAADTILRALKYDRELDAVEVGPVRKALGVLLGTRADRLPADLEKVLERAVPEPNVRVKNYDLDFDLSGKEPVFPARARITLDKRAPATTILEVNPNRLDIQSVQVKGKDVPFRVIDSRLHVDAPGAAALDIRYTVKPTDPKGAEAYGLIRDKYSGRMWTLTWPYNTGALFPSNSNPADGVTAKVVVRVAKGHDVVATGTKKGKAFVVDKGIPAYSIAIYAAKNFEEGTGGVSRGGVHVRGFGVLDAQISEEVRDAYRKTARDSLSFYASWLGSYEYGPTLNLVEVKGALGGMENAAAVAIMMGSARSPELSQEVAAHETAHHWFGDNLRIKHWGDFWLSEGFTQYATFRFFEHRDGTGKFHQFLDEARDASLAQLEANPHALSMPAGTDVLEIFDDVAYQVGPWILRMLEVELGRENMDALLKEWYRQHIQKAVCTEQFVAFVKKQTGKDLTSFIKDWGNLKAVPQFKAEVQAEGERVDVRLQAKVPHPRRIRIPLRLEGAQGEHHTVMVAPGKRVSVSAPFRVVKWSWDPERTVLAKVTR